MGVLAATHGVRRIQALCVPALLLVALVPGCSAIRGPVPWLSPAPTPMGGVAGELMLPEAAAAAPEPVVVYLEPLEAEVEAPASIRIATVRQHRGALRPEFLAVARGDAVRFLNEDEVYQQLFSASKPNDFDTGLLRRGESSVVRMRRPGVVRLYSALDETATGVIYVSPSRHFAVVYPPARFEIRDVPAGRYQLHTWRETGDPVRRELLVPPGAVTSLEIPADELWRTP